MGLEKDKRTREGQRERERERERERRIKKEVLKEKDGFIEGQMKVFEGFDKFRSQERGGRASCIAFFKTQKCAKS